MNKLYSSEGIILSRKNYGEADRILTIYSKNYGKISVIAKGVRRPKSRKRGHLEVFSLIKFQATATELGIITEADTINSFEAIRKSLKKVSVGYYFCEVVQKIAHDREENLRLFFLLSEFLKRLEVETGLKNLRYEFVRSILILLGYWPASEELPNPDQKLEEILERNLLTIKIGKRLNS